MDSPASRHHRSGVALAAFAAFVSPVVLAQTSVFDTGINSFLSWLFVFAQPLAVIAILVLGLFTLAGKVSWVGFVGGLTAVNAILGIPETLDVVAILPFGYPTRPLGKGKKQRKPLAQVAHRERYGQPLT